MTSDELKTLEVEAATFRHLRDFLREHSDVQNIDLMNLAGFCRNCLAKWYRAEVEQRGGTLDYEGARELVYGMPYAQWRDLHQREASGEQQAQFKARSDSAQH